MECCLKFILYSIVTLTGYTHLFHVAEGYECVKNIRNSNIGEITSPGYPLISHPNITCRWYITGQLNDIVTIRFADLNLLDTSRNCSHSWIELGPSSDRKPKRYCGVNYIPPSFISSKYHVWITYHLSDNAVISRGTGFRIVYSVAPKQSVVCKLNQYHCHTGNCIPIQWTCNGRFECSDGSDELNCKHVCTGNYVHCGDGKHCFNQLSQHCNGVFDCPNGVDEINCGGCRHGQFMCRSSTGCYSPQQRCDGIVHCSDYSDELGCGKCNWNEARCSIDSQDCYRPQIDRCNGKFECFKGEDELNCPHSECPDKLKCNTGKSCYTPAERCDSIANCADSSDERNCSKEVCHKDIGGFLCHNKLCIRESWICDQTNDCGDFSDEQGCVKNSVITAAVMGALICGLLLVIAVGCTCKLCALRVIEQHDLNNETPMSQMEREFLQREPPPPYSVAVGGLPFYNQDPYGDYFRISFPTRPNRARSGRRSRRHQSRRRRAPSPPSTIVSRILLNDSESCEQSPETSATDTRSTDDPTTVPSCTDNNVATSDDTTNVGCDSSNKLPKPISDSTLLVVDVGNSQDRPIDADKSDSSSVCSLTNVDNIDGDEIRLDTMSLNEANDEEFIDDDDMQSLCAS